MKIKISSLDKRAALECKKRDDYRCQKCLTWYGPGPNKGLQAAHIFTRARRTTRWFLDNLISLCTGCHMWAHHNPDEWREWLIENWFDGDPGMYTALRQLSMKVISIDIYLQYKEGSLERGTAGIDKP